MSGGFNNTDYVVLKNKTAISGGVQITSLITDSATTESQALTSLTTTADPGIFTITGHGFIDGEMIQLVGTDVVPTLNGIHTVNVIDSNTFDIGREVTGAGTITGTVEQAAIHTVVSHGLIDGQIVDINTSTATISGGLPADGTSLVVFKKTNDTFTVGIFTITAGTTANVTSVGTDLQPREITYYCAACPDILNISIGSPGIFTTSSAHNLVSGDRIYVYNSGTTPNLNGYRFVTVTSNTQFNVSITTTVSPIPASSSFHAEKYAVKHIIIDNYNANGDPTYLGNLLLNQRYNVAESRFEYTPRKVVNFNGLHVTDSRFQKIAQSGHTTLLNATISDLNDSINANFQVEATATLLTFVSTSIQDSFFLGGATGITSVLIQGLDQNLNEITDVIPMNGTVPINSNLAFRTINIGVGLTGGTPSGGAIGMITITKAGGGQEFGRFVVGDTTCEVGRYTVKAGYRFLGTSIVFSVIYGFLYTL